MDCTTTNTTTTTITTTTTTTTLTICNTNDNDLHQAVKNFYFTNDYHSFHNNKDSKNNNNTFQESSPPTQTIQQQEEKEENPQQQQYQFDSIRQRLLLLKDHSTSSSSDLQILDNNGYNVLHIAVLGCHKSRSNNNNHCSNNDDNKNRNWNLLKRHQSNRSNSRLQPRKNNSYERNGNCCNCCCCLEKSQNDLHIQLFQLLCDIAPDLMRRRYQQQQQKQQQQKQQFYENSYRSSLYGETPFQVALRLQEYEMIQYMLTKDPGLARLPFLVNTMYRNTFDTSTEKQKGMYVTTTTNILPLHYVLLDPNFNNRKLIRQLLRLFPEACKIQTVIPLTTYNQQQQQQQQQTQHEKHGFLPLHIATLRKLSNVVTYILKLFPNSSQWTDFNGNIALHYVRDDVHTAKKLLHVYPNGLYVQNNVGQLPIHSMLSQNHCWLNCINIVTTTTSKTRTRIYNDGTITEVLDLFYNLAPDTFSTVDHKGRIPLHVAIEQSCLHDSEINNSDHDINTIAQSLTQIMSSQHSQHRHLRGIVDQLIYLHPKSLLTPNSITGELPIHIALQQLKQQQQQQPHKRLCFTLNLQHIVEMCQMFLKLHPECIRKRNSSGNLPFHILMAELNNFVGTATEAYNPEDGVMHLLRDMLDLYPQCLYKKDSFGLLPLHTLLLWQRFDYKCDTTIDFFLNCFNLLIHKCMKAVSFTELKLERLPIHIALERLCDMNEVIHRDDHFDKTIINENDSTTFNQTLKKKWCDLVCQPLLKLNPDCAKYKDKTGRYPIHCFAKGFRSCCCLFERDDVLLQCQQPKYSKSSNGTFPSESLDRVLSFASSSFEIMKLLVESYPDALTKRDFINGNLPIHEVILTSSHLSPCHSCCWYDIVTYLAVQNPDSLTVYNYAGYTPMHLLCTIITRIPTVKTFNCGEGRCSPVTLVQTFLLLSPICGTQRTVIESYSPLFLAASASTVSDDCDIKNTSYDDVATLNVLFLLSQNSLPVSLSSMVRQRSTPLDTGTSEVKKTATDDAVITLKQRKKTKYVTNEESSLTSFYKRNKRQERCHNLNDGTSTTKEIEWTPSLTLSSTNQLISHASSMSLTQIMTTMSQHISNRSTSNPVEWSINTSLPMMFTSAAYISSSQILYLNNERRIKQQKSCVLERLVWNTKNNNNDSSKKRQEQDIAIIPQHRNQSKITTIQTSSNLQTKPKPLSSTVTTKSDGLVDVGRTKSNKKAISSTQFLLLCDVHSRQM